MHSKKLFVEYALALCIGILGVIGRNTTFAGVSSNEGLYQTIKRICLDEKYTLELQKSCILQAILSIQNLQKLPFISTLLLPEHASAEKDLITFQSHDAHLSGEADLSIAQEALDIMSTEVARLVSLGYLDAHDLRVLDQKIEVNYVRSCGSTKGSYHMLQSDDGQKVLFKNIVLNINLCNLPDYRARLDEFVAQILLHELGHYLYFFKDTSIATFDQICREDGESLCQSDDFVSAYAMQGKEEDYAESFTYRYLQKHRHSSMIVDQKHTASPETRIKSTKLQYFDIAYDQ